MTNYYNAPYSSCLKQDLVTRSRFALALITHTCRRGLSELSCVEREDRPPSFFFVECLIGKQKKPILSKVCLSPTLTQIDRYRKPSRAEVYLISTTSRDQDQHTRLKVSYSSRPLSPLSLFKRGGVSELSDTQSVDRSQATSFLFQFTEDTPNRDRFKKQLIPAVFSRFRN